MKNKKDNFDLPPMSIEETNKIVYKQARKKTMLDFITIKKKKTTFLPKIRDNKKYE